MNKLQKRKRIFFTSVLIVALVMNLSGYFFLDEKVYGSTDLEDLRKDVDRIDDNVEEINDAVNRLIRNVSDLESRPLPTESSGSSGSVAQKPKVTITSPTSISMKAGTSGTYKVVLKNVSSDTAYDVLPQIKPNTQVFLSAYIDGSDTTQKVLNPSATYEIPIKIEAGSKLETGAYNIDFKLTYYNNKNEEQTAESTIVLKVENNAVGVKVILKDMQSTTANGTDYTITANVRNDSDNAVKNIQVSLDGLKSEEFYISNESNRVDVGTLGKGEQRTISFKLKKNSKIAAGSYPVTFKLRYQDEKAADVTDDYVYYIATGGDSKEDRSEIIIQKITAPSGVYLPAQDFTMTVVLKNTSNSVVKNINVTAKPEGEGQVVPKSTSILSVSQLNPGETKELSYSFAATASAKSQNYVVGFTVAYPSGETNKDNQKETISFTQYQGVNVTNPEADKKDKEEEKKDEKTSTPVIIVEKYASDPVIVSAGREFDLEMVFLNTHSEKTIYNIKAYLTVDEGTDKKGNVFSPVNSSNTFFIDQLTPKGNVSKKMRFYTVPDASPKTYKINVNFEYEDAEYNQYKSTDIIGINVKQITMLELGEIDIPEQGNVGETITINFQFYNTGKVALSNLMIKVMGDFNTAEASAYYGNFTPSASDYFEGEIVANEPGTKTGKVIVSYEDDMGEKKEMEREFTVEIMDSAPMGEIPPEGMMIDPETGMLVPIPQEGGFPWQWIIGGVAGIAVIIVVVLVVRHRRKKKGQEFGE